MTKILIIFVILAVVIIGWVFLRNKENVVMETPTPVVLPDLSIYPESTVIPTLVVSKNIITYTDSGYTPNTITIKKGETVTWKNESSVSMWIASAVHPTHKVYPSTDAAACGTQTLLPMFDACAGVVAGQSWSFQFNYVGTWGFHNHARSSHTGKIVVIE